MTEQKRPILIIKGKRGSKVSTLESAVKPVFKPKDRASIVPKIDEKQKAKKAHQPAKVKQEPPKVKQEPIKPPKVRNPEQRAKNRAKEKVKRKAKIKAKQEAAMSAFLIAFPELLDFESPKPLKIGIDRQLIKFAINNKLNITKNQIHTVLALYGRTAAYQKALSAGGFRYDLNGQQCSRISDRQSEIAKERFNKLEEEKP